MIRLLIADLVRSPRPWIGLVAVTAAVAAVALFVVGLFAQVASTDHDQMQMFLTSLGSFVAIGTGISVLIVTGGTAALSVSLRRRTIALWQAVGILPRRVWLITAGQVALAALVGSVVGALLGVLGYAPMYRYGLSTLDGLRVPEPQVPVWAPAMAVGAVVLLTTLAGLRGARRAAKTEIVALLREPEPRASRGRWVRGVFGVLVVGGVVALALASRGDQQRSISMAPLLGPLLATGIAVAGPVLYAPVIRLWTAVVPARVSSSWFLARNTARFRVGFSAAAIGPLIVAIVLVASLYAAGATLSTMWSSDRFSIEPSQVAIMLGGPLLVSVVGAAAAVYVTGSDRTRERALLTAAGARPATLLVAAVWEACILTGTAVLIGTGAVALTAFLVHIAAETPHAVIDPAPIALIGGAGLALMLAATTVPAMLTRSDVTMRALAAE